MNVIVQYPSGWCSTSRGKLSRRTTSGLTPNNPLVFHKVMAHEVRNKVDKMRLIIVPENVMAMKHFLVSVKPI